MDRYRIRKLFKGHYQVIDDREKSLFEGSISDCYCYLRLFVMNLIED
jgi:hypothetical protein